MFVSYIIQQKYVSVIKFENGYWCLSRWYGGRYVGQARFRSKAGLLEAINDVYGTHQIDKIGERSGTIRI